MAKEYILLTGATGFIGAHVCRDLLRDDAYHVIAVVRRCNDMKDTISPRESGIILEEGIFYDVDFLEMLFKKYLIRNVVHLAAIRGGGAAKTSDYYEVNILGTENLLRASLKNGVRRFLFCSSVGVFGTIPQDLPAKVTDKLHCDNSYHQSKVMAERKVLEYVDRGLDAYIMRPAITYGSGDNGFSRTLIKMVRKRFWLLPSKDILVHLVNVETLSRLFLLMLKSDALNRRVYVAADEAPISLRELVNLIHVYYYGVDYPSYLKLPTRILKAMAKALQIIGSEKWLTRIMLISRSWYYDISGTVNTFECVPSKTSRAFISVLDSY
jgi:nucleoside-diphosphate-sugar epimerase